MELVEKKLKEISDDLTGFTQKAQSELTSLGTVQAETKTALESIKKTMFDFQTQLDAVDKKVQGNTPHGGDPTPEETISDLLFKTEEYKEAKDRDFSIGKKHVNVHLKKSAFALPEQQRKAITNTGLGAGTSGVLMPTRIPGIFGIPKIALRIRDLMRVRTQTEGSTFDFVYQSTRTNNASPQIEAAGKSQSDFNWATGSGTIRTIAHYTKVSKQALSDLPWMRGAIDDELLYGLKVKEEAEILAGDGTGVHLNGLITQATAFDTAVLVASAGWTRLDVLRYAKLQARLAGLASYAPTAFVLHPYDLAKLELTKDANGLYIVGDPKTGVDVTMLWGLPTVESDSIAQGRFLVGAFANAADLIDRMSTTIDISFEDGNNFTENMATVLCEERIGLAVEKAAAFISGTFSTSPATT